MDRVARKENTRKIINTQSFISVIGMIVLCVGSFLRALGFFTDNYSLVLAVGITQVLYGAITPTIIVIIRDKYLHKKGMYL